MKNDRRKGCKPYINIGVLLVALVLIMFLANVLIAVTYGEYALLSDLLLAASIVVVVGFLTTRV